MTILRKARPRSLRRRIGPWLAAASLVLVAAALVGVPLWMVLVNSWKTGAEALSRGLTLPTEWRLVENYSVVLQEGGVLRGLRNTLIIVVPSVIGILVLAAMASWVFARVRRRAISLLYYGTIASILFPPAIVTSIALLRGLGLYGTHLGLVLLYIGVFMAFGVLLITGFVKTIPIELEEAARIDGASQWTVFWRIVFPLLGPVLATGGFIIIVQTWNDFFFPFFVLTSGEQSTLTLSLFSFVSTQEHEIRWQIVFANIALSSLPLLLMYTVVHRRVIEGLTAGSGR